MSSNYIMEYSRDNALTCEKTYFSWTILKSDINSC